MAAFKARGLRVQPFKVGPDFIDPGFHSQITGMESRNLDGWMLGRAYNEALFLRLLERAEMAIVEGVMGLFDGYDGLTESGSSAEMAKWLGLPVVLVVDARSMARSAAALVHGFRHFDPGLRFAGVIFNRVGGEGHLDYLKEAMSVGIPEIPVLGGIPREEPISLPERHLGLVTADEIHLGPEWERNLARLVERYVDLDLMMRMGEYRRDFPALEPEESSSWVPAPSLKPAGTSSAEVTSLANSAIVAGDSPVPLLSGVGESPVTLAVARDAAFCFYYPDNFDLLRDSGALLHFFSPLAGECFPANAAGLYLGGGYPELHAAHLSSQKDLLAAVRGAISRGMPVYAECGGLMVLSRFIQTLDGDRYPMAGVLPFGTRMLPRRKALGYTEVLLQADCLLGDKGLIVRGHEFHYSEVVEEEADPALDFAYHICGRKLLNGRVEGYVVGSVLASYVHLHWGSAPEAAASFVGQCRKYRARLE
jgi:cobyrinic acid a,c-diamide synthase